MLACLEPQEGCIWSSHHYSRPTERSALPGIRQEAERHSSFYPNHPLCCHAHKKLVTSKRLTKHVCGSQIPAATENEVRLETTPISNFQTISSPNTCTFWSLPQAKPKGEPSKTIPLTPFLVAHNTSDIGICMLKYIIHIRERVRITHWVKLRELLVVSHSAWMQWWLCSALQLIQTDEEDMETLAVAVRADIKSKIRELYTQ